MFLDEFRVDRTVRVARPSNVDSPRSVVLTLTIMLIASGLVVLQVVGLG